MWFIIFLVIFRQTIPNECTQDAVEMTHAIIYQGLPRGDCARNVSEKKSTTRHVKNNNALFERPFKVKKNGVFLFGISFFVLEIFTFLYYANEGSDDVIDRSTKTIKY